MKINRSKRVKPNKDNTRMRLYFDDWGVSCLVIKREVGGQSDVNLGELPQHLPRRDIGKIVPTDKFYIGHRSWDDLNSGKI